MGRRSALKADVSLFVSKDREAKSKETIVTAFLRNTGIRAIVLTL
jgi:hypothetical protein